MRFLASSFLVVLFLYQAVPAHASCSHFSKFPFNKNPKFGGSCCTLIKEVPATIDTGGVYCLGKNLSTDISSGGAINIEADDVTLDLSGFALTGTAGPDTGATGIRSDNVHRITVVNGTVRGFLIGVNLIHGPSAPVSHIVRGIRADSNTQYGIRADGAGVLIENNFVTDTGGPAVDNAWGIEVAGSGHAVSGNVVSGVTATSQEVGILTLTIGGGAVSGNQVSNVDAGIQALAAGGGTGAVNVRDNTVANSAVDMGSTGIDGGFSGDSLCKDNMVYNFSTAFDNCTDGGGNASLP